jgi:hypothetical protein
MTATTYTAEERAALEAVGRRRTVEALVDLRQRHLGEFDG